MTVLQDMQGAIQEAFTINFQGITVWITYILYALFIIGILYIVFLLTRYRVKVTYYPIRGDPKDLANTSLGRPKKDYGAYYKNKKGNEEFRLLFARKKLAPVPFSMRYDDGVYFLQKSNSEFQVIPRPQLGNPSVKLFVSDPAMDLWATVQKQRIAERTADEDVTKRNMMMTIGVAVACLLFAGIVIWFISGLASQTITSSVSKADQLINAIQGLAVQGGGAG